MGRPPEPVKVLQQDVTQGARRQLPSELMDTMPIWYNGYKLYNPWTTPAENLGWSLLLIGGRGGTAAAINKINGLAWSVLALANLTETALLLLNDEVMKCFSSLIRKAVTRTVTSVNMQRRPDKEYEMPDVRLAPSFVPKPPMHDIIVDLTDSDIE